MKRFIYTLVILAFAVSLNAQWVPMSSGIPVNGTVKSLTVFGSNIFAGTLTQGVYMSTNNATSWSQTTLNNQDVMAVITNGSYLLAGTFWMGVFVSSNNGANWTQSSLSGQAVFCFSKKGTTFFAGTANGLYYSNNNGYNWLQSSIPTGKTVRSLLTLGDTIYAGTSDNNGVYISNNGGINWTQSSLNNKSVYSLAAIGQNIFAGTYGNGVYKSINNGITWSQSGLGTNTVNALISYNNCLIAGLQGGGSIYITTNYGLNWIMKNEGMGAQTVYSFLVNTGYIFAGLNASSYPVYRRNLSDIIGIKQISSEVPALYLLGQNYPNPFNPITKIKFDVARVSDVKIVVYDAMGREVQTLVNESLKPGTYEATFNGSQLTSGVYFYRMQTDGNTETKRMTLIK